MTRRPLIIEEIVSEKMVMTQKKEKRAISGFPVPEGHVRVIVVIGYAGMQCWHDPGDIIDLPERRFKTLGLRGYVREYKGKNEPGKR